MDKDTNKDMDKDMDKEAGEHTDTDLKRRMDYLRHTMA
jgi:hypothetical protein